MKRTFLLFTFLSFLPIHAFGDFVPGRVRATAKAKMARVEGNGRYQNVRSAQMFKFETDGKGTTKFTLALDTRPLFPFKVMSVRPNRCGRTFSASSDTQGLHSELQIIETNPESCRQDGPSLWRATISTKEGRRGTSNLLLTGEPEFFILTQ